MNTDDVTQAVIRLVWLALRLAARGVALLARALATITAQLAPRVNSRRAALWRSIAIIVLSAVLLALIFAVIAGGSAAWAGAALGVVSGGLAGRALLEQGRAQAWAAEGGVTFGRDQGRLGLARPHVVSRASRVRHLAVYGATGAGKSTVLTNLALQDAAAPSRPGLMVVDVKDDLVTTIARALPAHRLDDVLLFDPADTAFPPAFNPLAEVPPEGRTLAAAETLAALKRLYADSWGPRLEHVLRMTLLTLLETPEATLLDIARLLTDPDYRMHATEHVTNESVRAFWAREFPAIAGARGSLANVESILNKLGVFAYPEVRNVLGQTRRGLDLRAAMESGGIVLVNLPQGVLGEDAAMFLASLLVGKAQLAAQSRVTQAAQQRRPFYLFVDEFQNYATSAFDKLVTEGRSMAVGVVAACQYREQLDVRLRLTLERNCARALECRLVAGKHVITVIKLQEPEAVDAATLVQPLPPARMRGGDQLTAIRTRSRARLARPREEVEAAIAARYAGTAGRTARGGPGDAASDPTLAPSRRPAAPEARFFD